MNNNYDVEKYIYSFLVYSILMKLYMQDFKKPKTTKDEICDALQEVSYEDKKFIKMMNEETVKIGRHYQTPHCHSETRRCTFQTTGDWMKADLLV